MKKYFLPALVSLFLAACATPQGPAGQGVERPAAPARVMTPEPPEPAERDESAAVPAKPSSDSDIYFAFGAATLDDAAKLRLRALAERLKAAPRDEVHLVGSTDYLGSRAYNLAIAEQRVSEVVKFLRSLGIPGRQIKTRLAGNTLIQPACRTAECRQQMRRVQIIYTPAQK